MLKESCFSKSGNISFGIHEYIDIPGLEYDPKLGVLGLQVCVTLQKPGARVQKRKLNNTKVPMSQRVSREEAMAFMKDNYKIQIGEAV